MLGLAFDWPVSNLGFKNSKPGVYFLWTVTGICEPKSWSIITASIHAPLLPVYPVLYITTLLYWWKTMTASEHASISPICYCDSDSIQGEKKRVKLGIERENARSIGLLLPQVQTKRNLQPAHKK